MAAMDFYSAHVRPYLEEALKEEAYLAELLRPIIEIEELLQQQ